MSSYMATNNRRLDNLVAALKEQQTVAVHFSHAVEDTVESHIHTLSALTANVVKTSNTLSMLEVQYGNLLSSVETLVSGSIPAFLLPLNVLGNTLSSIQVMLERDFRGFHLVHSDPNYYYHSADFSYTRRRPNDIFITIKFPISSLRVFHYYRVHAVPSPTHDDTNHVTMLNDLPAIFATSNNNQQFLEISEEEMPHIPHMDLHRYRTFIIRNRKPG